MRGLKGNENRSFDLIQIFVFQHITGKMIPFVFYLFDAF